MPLKRCVLFATHSEADACLQLLQASPQSDELYHTEACHILITGMGPGPTEIMLKRHLNNYDEILNFGIAGGLKSDLSREELFPIAKVSFGSDSIILQERGHSLYTQEVPLYDPVLRDRLAQQHDLVDMEGYIIAKLCLNAGKTCRLYKIISDFCTETTSAEIKQALPQLSLKLAHHLIFSLLSLPARDSTLVI